MLSRSRLRGIWEWLWSRQFGIAEECYRGWSARAAILETEIERLRQQLIELESE